MNTAASRFAFSLTLVLSTLALSPPAAAEEPGKADRKPAAKSGAKPVKKTAEMKDPPPSGPSSTMVFGEALAAIIASPDRSAEDRANDARRKPQQMLSFIGVNRGMTVLDLSAGGGYTSELLARTAGQGGQVYAQVAPRAEGPPPSLAKLKERAQKLTAGKIIPTLRPFEDPAPEKMAANSFELATMMFNYHDLGHLGVDRDRLNRAVFKALKPGSMYVIADHAGRPGTGISESGTLHRVEEALVRKEVEAAGFKFIESANFLHNPADPRDKKTPDDGQPKDEFVLKFIKP